MTNTIRSRMFTGVALLGLGVLNLSVATAQPARVAASTAETPATDAAPQGRHGAAAHVDQRIGELHAKLAITPEQQPQWDRFTQVMRDNARAMDSRFQRRRQTIPTMSAAENMQSYAQLVLEHGQDVQKLSVAFNTLYASLSEPQRRTADQSFRDDAHRGDPTRGRR